MAPPPAKKQRRLLDLTLSDDTIEQSPINTRSKTSKTSISSKLKRPTTRSNAGQRPKETPDVFDLPEDCLQQPDASKIPSTTKSPSRRPLAPAKVNGERKGSIQAFLIKENVRKADQREEPKRIPPKTEELDLGDDIEEISDYDPESPEVKPSIPSIAPSKSTRLVLDRRKPTEASSGGQTVPADILPLASQKFKTLGRAASSPLQTAGHASRVEDKRPWVDRFGPSSFDELAIHKKKASDVRGWLEVVFSGKLRQRLLILKGPSGSGKTATINTLAQALDFKILEWKNPSEADFGTEGYASTYTQFDEFLGRSGRFGGLQLSGTTQNEDRSHDTTGASQRKIILVEEFPNTFVSSPRALEQFRSSILAYIASNGVARPSEDIVPLILIITETHLTTSSSTSDAFTAHRLLGPGILHHPLTTCIEYNPIAPTFVRKALDLVLKKEARHCPLRKLPKQDVLKKLAEYGDVRSATNALEFLCLHGSVIDPPSDSKLSSRKAKSNSAARTPPQPSSLAFITQRESSLGLFHAVGKVVYNKRDDSSVEHPIIDPPPHLVPSHARPKIPQTNPDSLIDEAGTDILTFIAALQGNYVVSCADSSSMETPDDCANILSDADTLSSVSRTSGHSTYRSSGRSGNIHTASEELRREEIAFHVATRGLLFHLPYPVKRSGGNHKMGFPQSARLWQKKEEIQEEVEAWRRRGNGIGKSQVGFGYTGVEKEDEEGNESDGGGGGFPVGLETTEQLLLERLPFLTKILAASIPSASASIPSENTATEVAALERITGLSMLSQSASRFSEDQHDEAEDDQLVVDEEEALRPKKEAQKKISSDSLTQEAAAAADLAVATTSQQEMGEEVQKLYLSEDDIED